MSKFEVKLLQGWLMKQKSSTNKSSFASYFSNENRRWFKVTEVVGMEDKEWTLAYYDTQRSLAAKGFIYLRDVTSLHAADDLSITIKSPSRIMTVIVETMSEHSVWLEGLAHLCTSATVTTEGNSKYIFFFFFITLFLL
jgi:hypothetical protein